jgi:hypothetical protein
MELPVDTTYASLPPTVISAHEQTQRTWSLATRIAFRFVFAYFALYNFPFPLDLLPFTNSVLGKYDELWKKIVPWVGSHVLNLAYPITVFPNGSGDTTFNYVLVFCFLVLAAVVTLVWSILDKRRTEYTKLHQWFSLYIRLVLGSTMIGYGAAKAIPSQMPAPGLSVLTENYGDSSPMRLLWTLMGASKGYEIFAGVSEMVGGLLLFVPALATLGALLLLGVLSNVFMLNMCYDVPVKLYSFHLLLMAVFLLAPDLRKLSDLFVFHKKAQLSSCEPVLQRKWLKRSLLALQLTFAIFLVGISLHSSRQLLQQMSARSPLYGIWSVDEYSVDGNLVPQVETAATRWRRVIVDFPQRLSVQPMAGPPQRFLLQLDEAKKSLTLAKRTAPDAKTQLSYQNPEPRLLFLSGQIDGHRVTVKATRIDESNFLLTTRGFHWINEYPLNQ